MSRDLNKVFLMGRLGGDPELRFTATGKPVANFSLATNNRYTDAGGVVHDDVSWHRCVAWGKTGELIAQYARRGHRIWVEARLQYRKWQDTASGVERLSCDVVVEQFIFLSAVAGSSSAEVASEVNGAPVSV